MVNKKVNVYTSKDVDTIITGVEMEDNNIEQLSEDLKEEFELNPEELTKNESESKNSNEILLPKDIFGVFIDVLQMLKGSCQDLIAEDGWICQSNSKKSAVFLIDLTPIIKNTTLYWSNLGLKLDLLNVFRKQLVDVKLEIDNEKYIFKDKFTKLTFRKSDPKYLENVKLPRSKVQNTISNQDTLLFRYKWNKTLLERLSVFSKTLSNTTIKFDFEGENIYSRIYGLDNRGALEVELFRVDDSLINDTSIVNYTASFLSNCLLCLTSSDIVEADTTIYKLNRNDKNDNVEKVVLEVYTKLPVPGTNSFIDIKVYSLSNLTKKTLSS